MRDAAAFPAFEDDAAARILDGLVIENGTDAVRICGEISITRDRAGLAKALALRDVVEAVAAALIAHQDLPDRVTESVTVEVTANPFA